MATQAEATEVREMIGEVIPEGGTEDDTLFTTERIEAWIDASATLEGAALTGWRRKAAHWAGLVSVTDGAASREFSDLFDHAQEMIKTYSKLATPSTGRTRVGKIVRT